MSKVVRYVIGIAEIVVGVLVIIGTIGWGTPVGVSLILAGVSTIAATALAPGMPKLHRSDNNAPVSHLSVNTDAYGSLVYGTARVSGVLIYQNVCSSDGSQTYDILDYVVAHCFTDPTRGVEHMGDIYINDQLIPESAIDGSGNVISGDFAGMVQVWRYDGTQTAADSVLVAAYGSDAVPWPATAIGRGVCYTHYRFKSGTDQDKFNQTFGGGPPNNAATVIKGEKCYDPRTSSYAWTENPAICLRDFLTRSDNGANVDPSYLNASLLAASANICDEVVTYPGGATGPRFRLDGVAGLGDSRKSIIGDMLDAMIGEVVQSQGVLGIRSGSYTPPSGAITEDFLRGTASSSEPTQDMRYNHVRASFVDIKSNWQTVQAPPFPALSSTMFSDWQTADGTRIDKQVDLKFVNNADNAQLIEQIIAYKSRFQRAVSLQGNAKCLAYTVGDRVTLDIDEIAESSVTFKVVSMQLRPDFGVDVNLMMDDPSIYGWDNTLSIASTSIGPPGVKRSKPPAITGFAVKQGASSIGIQWDATDTRMVDYTQVERSTANTGPFGVIYRGAGNTITDHLPGDTTTYYYRAKNMLGGTSGDYTTVLNQAGAAFATDADVAAANAAAAAAQSSADAANAQLADISSDNILSPVEKPQVIQDNTVILAEQSGIDAQATAYGITTQKTAYDNAVSALTGYLATLTSPVLWSNLSGDTTIVGTTFRSKFSDVYTTRQALLNAIYNTAQTLANNAQSTATAAFLPGQNMISDPMYMLGAVYWHNLGTHWSVQTSSLGNYLNYTYQATAETVVTFTDWIPCAPNQAMSLAMDVYMSATGAGSMNSDVEFADAGYNHSAYSARSFQQSAATAATTRYGAAIGTSPANTAYCRLRLFGEAVSGSGQFHARRIKLEYGATPTAFSDDATQYGNQLANPGSGQTIGDQRNLLPVTWAGVRSVLSTSPISYSISGTTVTFSVTAFTLQGGGISISYSAASASVAQSAGTTVGYYLYYRDATASGGSKSLFISTNPQALAAFPDIVMLGTATVTVASGGGGTGGTGGGGGGYCVADDMFIGDDRRAGDADIGDPFDCIDLPTAAGKHVRALQGVSRGVEECVRMITSNGCMLVCSVSTPFDLPDGRGTTAPHMLGEQVITDLGSATVTSLALVGPRPVTRAHLGGVSYAAGADPNRRIYSHNVGTPSKP